jgi:hypothetical protein
VGFYFPYFGVLLWELLNIGFVEEDEGKRR